MTTSFSDRRRRGDFVGMRYALLGIAVIIGVLVLVVWPFTNYQSHKTQTVTVCDKERAATGSGGEYRIYTDKGTFVMKDSWLGGTRFDTADAYGKIKKGVSPAA